MYADAGAAPQTRQNEIPLETMRALAVVLLVSFHVIGPNSDGGLRVAYPDMLRLYADFFVDLRMPLFGFIAGYVYALRPPSMTGYAGFVLGKLRRLYLPGIVAILAFVVVAAIMGNRFAVPLTEAWQPLFYSYAHFWFLQSILVIFVLFGFLDALLEGRFTLLFLITSCVLYLAGTGFDTRFFSVNGALYLLPYFLLGVVFNRHAGAVAEVSERLTLVLGVLAVACALWNIQALYETGQFSMGKRDYQSLVFGLSMCSLMMMWSPRLPILERLSPYAFTIYLYHVFGTVAARMLCDILGIEQLDLRFVCGLVGGLALPVLLQVAARRMPVASVVVLGRSFSRAERKTRGSRPPLRRTFPVAPMDNMVKEKA